jgi:hypothetical protein
MRRIYLPVSWLILSTPGAFAQRVEVGAAVGGGFYQSKTVTSGSARADAGFENGLAGSAWIGQNVSQRIGGEIRYLYQRDNLKLSSGGASATFDGQSHAIHYDLLFHATSRRSRVRPFVLAGGGVKIYQGTGKEVVFQPLSNLALLTKTNDTKGLVTVGGGIKLAVTGRLQLRVDLQDYLTPFPTKVITPNQGAKVSGWISDFVALFGLAYTF